jgi:hypothetical protein
MTGSRAIARCEGVRPSVDFHPHPLNVDVSYPRRANRTPMVQG